jgi:hypothetical protein
VMCILKAGPSVGPNPVTGKGIPVIRDPSYSEGQKECPPRVCYSPEIDASKFTLHILSVASGGFQRLQFIMLIQIMIQHYLAVIVLTIQHRFCMTGW